MFMFRYIRKSVALPINVSVLLFLFLISKPSSGQEEFAPEGATWYWNYDETHWNNIVGYLKSVATDLVEIDGINFRKIDHYYRTWEINWVPYQYEVSNVDSLYYSHSSYYYQDGFKYYFWSESDNEIKLFADFSLQTGDTLHLDFHYFCYEPLDVIITETGTETVNGISLRYYKWATFNMFNMLTGKMVEKYFGYQSPFKGVYCVSDGFDILGLRCYEDNDLGQIGSRVADCEAISWNPPTNLQETSGASQFKIYPNPFDEWLFFSSQSAETDIMVFDLTGREIYSLKIKSGQKNTTVNTSTWDKGVYVVVVKDKSGFITYYSGLIKK